MKLTVEEQRFKLNQPFTIARGTRDDIQVLVARVEQDGKVGYGECMPYLRYGETVDGVRETIRSLKTPFDRAQLQSLLPPGAARNAVDCALWDLEAKLSGQRVWELINLSLPQPIMTSCTISLDSPDAMRRAAAACRKLPLLKIKLGGGDKDIDRIKAVRDGAPNVRLIVDANEGWDDRDFTDLVPHLEQLDVEMVEQPLPAGEDQDLVEKNCPLTVCADESCHGMDSFAKLPQGYGMVNIKLDKTGGLTEALQLKAKAKARGYQIMVGCMLGSSLAIAPALLLAQDAQIVDLDAPLWIAADRPFSLNYDQGMVDIASEQLWG